MWVQRGAVEARWYSLHLSARLVMVAVRYDLPIFGDALRFEIVRSDILSSISIST